MTPIDAICVIFDVACAVGMGTVLWRLVWAGEDEPPTPR